MERLLLFSRKVYDQRWAVAIRRGLLLVFPLIIIGSFAVLLANLPFINYNDSIPGFSSISWKNLSEYVLGGTFGIISLCIVAAVSYFIAAADIEAVNGKLNPLIASVLSIACYVIVATSRLKDATEILTDQKSIFLAIITAIISAELYIFLYNSKFFKIDKIRIYEEPVIPQALLSILPAVVVVVLFIVIKIISVQAGFDNVNELLYHYFTKLILMFGSKLLLILFFVLMNQLFWFFGVHGNFVLTPSLFEVFNQNAKINEQALAAGNLPTEFFSKPFLDVYVLIGGSGATICLLLALFIAARKSNTVQLVRISMFPAIFNINEIIIFGLPIVLNPLFFIPFLLAPIVLTLVALAAYKTGLVPPVINEVTWTMPPILNAWQATKSWKGIALQIFNLCLGTLIYLPFVRLNEIRKDRETSETYENLLKLVNKKMFDNNPGILKRNDQIGNLARAISKEIREAIDKDGFRLEYQPQMDDEGTVTGVEALLRWEHSKFGMVPPLLVVAVAEEAGLMNDLGRWVLRCALQQLGDWNRSGVRGLRMSVNISPTQLHDKLLPEALKKYMIKYDIDPSDIELEITECVAMEMDNLTAHNFAMLKEAGIGLAMDDFGMGYTSLLYIRNFDISTVKIDGSLTRDILEDRNCRDIISSLVFLCNSMNIKVIAEYVEVEGQKEILGLLGCKGYQGYFFSPPLPPDSCLEYVCKSNALK